VLFNPWVRRACLVIDVVAGALAVALDWWMVAVAALVSLVVVVVFKLPYEGRFW
jgi:hypothetical protein